MSNYQSKQTNQLKIMKEVNLKTSKIQKKLFSIKSDLDLTKQYAASAKEISVIDTVISTGKFKTIDGKTNEGLNFLKNKKAAIFYDMISSGCIESHLWQILQQSQKEDYFTRLKALQKPGHYDPNKKQVGLGSMDGGKNTFDNQIESYEEFLQYCCSLADEARKKYEIFDLYGLSEGLKKDLVPSSVRQYETNRIELYQQFSLQDEKWVCKIQQKDRDKSIPEEKSFQQSQTEEIKDYLQRDQKFIFCKEILDKKKMHKQLQQLEALRSPNPDNHASEMFSYDERKYYKIVKYSTKNLNKVNRDYVQKLRMEYLDGKTEVAKDLTEIYKFMVGAYNKLDKSGWLYLFKASKNFEGMRGNNITMTFGTEKLEELKNELETKGLNSLYYFFEDSDAFETAAQAEKQRVEKANQDQSGKRQWPVNSFFWLHGNYFYTVGKGVFDLVCWRHFINNWISKYLLATKPGVVEQDVERDLKTMMIAEFARNMDNELKTIPLEENFKKKTTTEQNETLTKLEQTWEDLWQSCEEEFDLKFGFKAFDKYHKPILSEKLNIFQAKILNLKKSTQGHAPKSKPNLPEEEKTMLTGLLQETKNLSQQKIPHSKIDVFKSDLPKFLKEFEDLSYRSYIFLKTNSKYFIQQSDRKKLEDFQTLTLTRLKNLWKQYKPEEPFPKLQTNNQKEFTKNTENLVADDISNFSVEELNQRKKQLIKAQENIKNVNLSTEKLKEISNNIDAKFKEINEKLNPKQMTSTQNRDEK